MPDSIGVLRDAPGYDLSQFMIFAHWITRHKMLICLAMCDGMVLVVLLQFECDSNTVCHFSDVMNQPSLKNHMFCKHTSLVFVGHFVKHIGTCMIDRQKRRLQLITAWLLTQFWWTAAWWRPQKKFGRVLLQFLFWIAILKRSVLPQ